jgi:Ser-tRNA(Ala) deacylase AlaX
MAATNKLYNSDHYLREFTAKVIEIKDNKVILNRTAFFPESGGQSGDIGILGDSRVIDTQINNDDIIHVLENQPTFSKGDIIEGKINWERRYNIMKLHTASHIMEHFLWKTFGVLSRSGSYVDEKKDRADYEYEGRLENSKLKKVEKETNEFLLEGHEITIKEDKEGIRHWKCGPVEMLCAGTHVKNTKEIGRIKLKRKNPGRGTERVETTLSK